MVAGEYSVKQWGVGLVLEVFWQLVISGAGAVRIPTALSLDLSLGQLLDRLVARSNIPRK